MSEGSYTYLQSWSDAFVDEGSHGLLRRACGSYIQAETKQTDPARASLSLSSPSFFPK